MSRLLAGRRPNVARVLAAVAVLALFALLAAGCSQFDSPQNTFAPDGEVASDQKNLFFLVMWPALAILILVEGLIIVACIRYRRRSDNEALPQQVHGNTALELTWTIAPALLLIVIAVPTLDGIFKLGRQPSAEALEIKVTGIQWAWEFEYTEIVDAQGAPLSAIEELHVPVGREIGIHLESGDVLHSFWVPKLAGKQDVVPGRRNHLWFKADRPGTYEGQCAEFCGTGHAGMRLRVIAQTPEDFAAWMREQGGTEVVAGQ